MPRPVGLPAETVSPEVSECSRIPESRRPETSAATPWSGFWLVGTFQADRPADAGGSLKSLWYGSPLYKLVLSGKVPQAFVAVPPDPNWRPMLRSRLMVAAGVLVLWVIGIETRSMKLL